MREIEFRAKREGGEWVEGGFCPQYGDPYIDEIGPAIITNAKGLFSSPIMIDPDTIGQYTGLTDKSGSKIFEGDVLKYPSPKLGPPRLAKVIFKQGCFHALYPSGIRFSIKIASMTAVVIGNIHDNPELTQ